MRSFVLKIIKWGLRLFPYRSIQSFNRLLNILYTHWLKREFGALGENSILERGMRLWNPGSVFIGDDVYIRRFGNISTWDSYLTKKFSPRIEIGKGCSIGEYFNISCVDKVTLGSNVLIGRWVTIIDHTHGSLDKNDIEIPPARKDLYSKGGIVIEDNVWIGDKVAICPNVHIEKGAIIGANSVVTKDVKSNTVVAGCPAKYIRSI